MDITINIDKVQDLGIKPTLVLGIIELNPGITQKKMCEMTKISQRTMFDIVEDLISRDLVEKAGWYLYSK